MNNPLNLSRDYAESTNIIFSCLGYPGLDVRYVGGCVRDHLINLSINDIDIATPDTPDEVIRKLNNQKIQYTTFGKDHGSIKAIIKNYTFDITSLRKDHLCDGRHAIVEYTNSWLDDAKRRDFTFNAISMSPSGELFDYFNGKEHIKEGNVKFIGDARDRIQEDFLRILRFFRFISLYGKNSIDPSLLSLCKEFSWGLERVSAERITSEISKILGSENPINVIYQMKSYKILDTIFGKYFKIGGLENLINSEKKYLDTSYKHVSWHLRLASILSYKQIIDSPNIILSNTDKILIRDIFNASAMISKVIDCRNQNPSLYDYLYKYGKESFAYHGFLLANSQHGNPSDHLWPDFLKKIISYKHLEFPFKAKDLINLGFEEGKHLGDELRYLENLWVNSGFRMTSREIREQLDRRKNKP